MMFAKVSHRFAGIHHWPQASGKHEYLKHPHRHLFHLTVWIEQYHDNRDVEYLEFKDWIVENCMGGVMNHKSCEMMARDLLEKIRKGFASWTTRQVRIEVLEDGENGAYLEERI